MLLAKKNFEERVSSSKYELISRRVLSPQVGGRLGSVFDEDPKRWRMLAETLATLGLSLEISTAFFPGESQM